MLYTFSQANYDINELARHLEHITEKDAIVLWQDGVLLALKFPMLLSNTNTVCFILETDLKARNLQKGIRLNHKIKIISLSQLVQLTEQYYPQLAL